MPSDHEIAAKKRPDDFSKRMAEIRAKSAFTKIMDEVEARHPPTTWNYDVIVSDPGLPVGHRRMVAVYFSTADIDNGGFKQYYMNCFGCLTVPAIEAYEKAGQTDMVKVMKIALKVSLNGGPISEKYEKETDIMAQFRGSIAETNFRLPLGFLEGVDFAGKNLEDLDTEFYALKEKLPGALDLPSGYPDGFITWYYNKFPEEFVFPT